MIHSFIHSLFIQHIFSDCQHCGKHGYEVWDAGEERII